MGLRLVQLAVVVLLTGASTCLMPAMAKAQGSECQPGSRLLRIETVMTPTGPARQPICLRSIRVRLWLKAFIPSEHPTNPGYIRTTGAGSTAIPGPIRDLAGVGDCFLTDQRMFSSDPGASARATVAMDIIIEQGRIARLQPRAGRAFVQAGPSHRVDCRSGASTGNRVARNGGIRVSYDALGVDVRGGIANPFYRLSPEIDFDLRIGLEPAQARLALAGRISVFPAYEAYYSIDGGPVQTLFQQPPAAGSSVWDLTDAWGGWREVSGTIPLPRD